VLCSARASGGTGLLLCSTSPPPQYPGPPNGTCWTQPIPDRSFLWCAGLCVGLLLHTASPLLRGCASLVRGETNVVSMASCEPCQGGSPLAMTSMVRSSMRWTAGKLRWASRVCIVTRAPASRQTRAAACSRGTPRLLKTPVRAQAERWSPRGS